MQVKYGSYPFNADDVAISHTKRAMRAETGLRTGIIDMWVLTFRLRGDTQAEITTAVNALYSAFAVDGKDLVLLDNDGNNSAFITDSGSTTSGVRVKDIDFPNLANGQYSFYIDGVVSLEAETVTNQDANLVYSDTLSISGNGGPKTVILETARGLPITQTTRQRTVVRGMQSGTAKALGAVPNKPLIMFPNLLINEGVQESITSGIEGGKIVYTLNWSYPYQSSNYFSGIPQARL